MSIEEIIGVFLLICFLGYFFYIVYKAVKLYGINSFKKAKKLTFSEKQLLLNTFPIYGQLPLKYKHRFEERIAHFRMGKKFIFQGEIEKKEELKLLLSATAVMLTLGVKDYLIASINRIIIYPSKYFSRLNNRHHLGEYNPKLKTLVFSAEHVFEGFKIPNDNRNLGVHEFAHALSFNAIDNQNAEDRTFIKGLSALHKLLNDAEFESKLNKSTYFRDYAKVNKHEFFAVAVENFVETPDLFFNNFPEIYAILKNMLRVEFKRT
ncbi:MAG: zinc-dependent peptidase [Cellulophaga sp.]